ncbi:menaquinone-dependent protoporphyrinogen IX dehydrogenase [Microvirga sp. W0021]|uniref:Protoporphyrinogen IX dehydrogenase [quinone] n=1 Tax=Hohaiivirga grylli TaxID=3133970 RepID=A0ABV0BH25_9HYPH
MAKILILFSSTDGHTRQVVDYMISKLPPEHAVTIENIDEEKAVQLESYDAVLMAASIRYGHFSKASIRFANKNASTLNMMPSAFFGFCLTARKPHKRTPETNVYLRKFLQRTGWSPKISAAIAGGLFYPRYKWFDRIAIQMIMRMTGGETDTRKEIVYTDWTQVDDLTDRVHQIVAEAVS